ELQSLRRQAQELAHDNEALKLTLHRLSVELSRLQASSRPPSQLEVIQKPSDSPQTGSPAPWLLDVKRLSPLLLAYEDRMKEKDELLQSTEEQVQRLRARAEEVIRENERLHDDISKMGGSSQEDCQHLQQQAFLVLQENQVLLDQLETQHTSHQSEVTRVTRQLMLLEEEKKCVEEALERSREEAQANAEEAQALRALLRDAVAGEEHRNTTENLRRQLEQQDSKNSGEKAEMLRRLSDLQEEKRRLAWDKANLTEGLRRAQQELELERQANREAERKMSALKRQTEECALKKETTLHHMEAVLSVVENISKERDQLLH
ncbi:unnamed protein product, partial [Tetraodon nigroviridis]